MKWSSTLSEAPSLELAVREASGDLRAGLDGVRPDLVAAFVSEHYAKDYEALPRLLRKEMGDVVLVGCSGGGVIGGGREAEKKPGLSLTAGVLPGVEIVTFHLESENVPEPQAGQAVWEKFMGVPASQNPGFLVLPDPFSFDADRLLKGLDAAYPASPKVGGLASGGRGPEANALYLGGRTYRSGAVGLALTGDIAIDTVVAQGCRPIGNPMFVTRCRDNVILELDGDSPAAVIQKLYGTLAGRDQELFRNALFLGIVMKESQSEYHQGDFLIRNLMGVDPQSGAIGLSAHVKENMVVQFHLRDAATSTEDLNALLTRYKKDAAHASPQGSLLFSCLGRGLHLFGKPDHDTDLFRRHFGEIPLGGFFCNGEIGPVHGSTFLHGYTSSFGIFRKRSA